MWFKRIYIGIFILIVLVIVVINVGMGTMKFTDSEAAEYFEESGFEGEFADININGRKVKIIAEELQESDSILLVFVHGAPGTWDAFKEYVIDKELNSGVRIVAYDRPGYGGSGTRPMPSIQDQSSILKKILELYGLERNILVGHSYGGPIVGNVALDRDSQIDIAIMISPLIDPKNEPLHWYSYFSYWKLTSWLLPSELVVAGSEKFAHSSELELMKDRWQNANCLFVHVHGLEDGLAPGIENIAFSKKHIPTKFLETIVYEDKGHLIIWTDYGLMKDIILKAINKIKNEELRM